MYMGTYIFENTIMFNNATNLFIFVYCRSISAMDQSVFYFYFPLLMFILQFAGNLRSLFLIQNSEIILRYLLALTLRLGEYRINIVLI